MSDDLVKREGKSAGDRPASAMSQYPARAWLLAQLRALIAEASQ